jgi:hypothetical protein
MLLRARYLVDVHSHTAVRGLPFSADHLAQVLHTAVLGSDGLAPLDLGSDHLAPLDRGPGVPQPAAAARQEVIR